MTYLLAAAVIVGGVLLVLLAAATGNSPLFAGHYDLLITLNAAVAIALLALVAYQLSSLARSLVRKRFGSRLTLRFLLLFALMALIPGALVYSVSVGFLAKSIESWFDVRVDNALEEGLNLGRAVLEVMLDELANKGRAVALDLGDVPQMQQPLALSRIRDQTGVDEVLLIGVNGVLASVSRTGTQVVPDTPSATVLRQARQNRGYKGVESVGDRDLVLRVIFPIAQLNLSDEQRLIQLKQSVPHRLVASAEAVESVNRDYRELALSRFSLRRIYIFALTLTLLLTLFAALALAFILSRRLSAPLATLAEATEAVARGDFTRRAAVLSADELGTLAKSFNSMTTQLADAYRSAEENRVQVEKARAHLENILTHLSTGVLVFDPELRLETANAAAGQILGSELAQLRGHALTEAAALAPLGRMIAAQFKRAGSWRQQMEFRARSQVLVLRGSLIEGADRTERLVVFDDVTALIEAQRAAAWTDVAQRLAHEIKNPLTPIQLAIERLRMKFADRLAAPDAAALERAAETIIAQVNAMKAMVDEFRSYSRLPQPKLAPLDLNVLINDVLSLYEHARERIRLELAPGIPLALGDSSQLRQVVHNLLQNADDALSGRREGTITVKTMAARDGVILRISDTGGGFPDGIMQRAFEPYVTTKPKGTGLGLAIVKKIIDEHQGKVELANRPEGGAEVTITLPRSASDVPKAA